jgi:hypothetical protein
VRSGMWQLMRASAKRGEPRLPAVRLLVICVLAGVLQAKPSPAADPLRYTYIIERIVFGGRASDTNTGRIKLQTDLREKLGTADVNLGDTCGTIESCDVIAIAEVERQQRFEVQFLPAKNSEINSEHMPKLTRQMQVDDQRMGWTLAYKDIVDIITKHHVTHTRRSHGADR